MKKITITNAFEIDVDDNGAHVATGEEDMDAYDGYHTFTELYDHRISLFIALCQAVSSGIPYYGHVWRSKLHSDGTMFDGWFIMGIGTEKGKQITYHLPINRWDETGAKGNIETLDRAPEWDGHTPADVLERLKNL